MTQAGTAPVPLAARPRHFIGGAWRAPRNGHALPAENPSTGEEFGAIAAGDADDVAAAVAAASEAMAAARHRKWSATARGEALWALADAVAANAEEFAQIEALDGGKPIGNARMVDVPGTIAVLRYFAGWATKLAGETVEMSAPGNWQGYTRRLPVGVVGQINPWNYPLMGAAFKIGPAIAAGCATVLKPAEQTSLSSLRLAELAAGCGFPPGFFNVVAGTGEAAGAALVAHPDVAKIAFTGSTEVGRDIGASCGRQLKRATLELGGKSPVIVLPDADLEAAAQGIAMSIFFNTGQTCSAGSRLFVHRSVQEQLIARIIAIARSMQIGCALDANTRIGPVVSRRQRDRVLGFVQGAVAKGAGLISGGSQLPGRGWFVEPAILTEMTADMPAATDEIFGPILCTFPFETNDLDEVAAMANATRYGLAAYVWTRDIGHALGLVDRLQAGTVRVNSGGGGDLSLPSGGVKQSGVGRENGRPGVEAYTEIQAVTVAY